MKLLKKLTVLALALLIAACCASPTQSAKDLRAPLLSPAVIERKPAVAQEISIEELKRMLPRHPIVVGFDVDDTLMFTAPAFNALQPQYDPDVIRPKDYAALTAEQKAKYHEFWNRLNKEFDDKSTPKEIGKKLLALHVARGDTIIVISKRQSTTDGVDYCTTRYERLLEAKFSKPVIQTQLQDKTPFIKNEKIEYYYGDSDSDITSAVGAGAVPIRVKRAKDSYAKDAVHNGELDEIVLKDSEK